MSWPQSNTIQLYQSMNRQLKSFRIRVAKLNPPDKQVATLTNEVAKKETELEQARQLLQETQQYVNEVEMDLQAAREQLQHAESQLKPDSDASSGLNPTRTDALRQFLQFMATMVPPQQGAAAQSGQSATPSPQEGQAQRQAQATPSMSREEERRMQAWLPEDQAADREGPHRMPGHRAEARSSRLRQTQCFGLHSPPTQLRVDQRHGASVHGRFRFQHGHICE